MNRATFRSRARGALLGLAIGDALGATVEFQPPGTFEPIEDMIGGGPFDLEPGAWTDDTSMALCLAESLLERRGFDPIDQLERFLLWYYEGYNSSTGECFDIRPTTLIALQRFERTREPFPGDANRDGAGNGSLMRLAPVPIAFATHPSVAVARCAESSRTTHGAPQAADAARYFGGLIVGALNGVPREELIELPTPYEPAPGIWEEEPLHPEIEEVAAGSFRWRQPPEIRGAGYVTASLEAALWAVHSARDFGSAVLAAVNLGEDADTTAAIAGQLAGALYGLEGIPAHWRTRVHRGSDIVGLADRLAAIA